MKPATRLEERRYATHYIAVAIEMHTGIWVRLNLRTGETSPIVEWNSAKKKLEKPTPVSRLTLDKLRRRPKTKVIGGHYLISERKLIQPRKYTGMGWRYPTLSHQGIVQKQNTQKKRFIAKRLKREAERARREFIENIRQNDPHGINAIPNTAFGHPKRMKAFSLKERTEKRNEQAYKERNIPPLSDD